MLIIVRQRFADGGRIAQASGEPQSAAWGGGELPISHGDIETAENISLQFHVYRTAAP